MHYVEPEREGEREEENTTAIRGLRVSSINMDKATPGECAAGVWQSPQLIRSN